MTTAELRAVIARANHLVDAMPPWKRHVLEQSGQPTVAQPGAAEPNLDDCGSMPYLQGGDVRKSLFD